MRCTVCGNEIPDGSKFCIFCGNAVKAPEPQEPVAEMPAVQEPVYTATEETILEPEKTPEKKSKAGLVILGVAAVVLVAALAVGLFWINLPAVKVPAAIANSMGAYAPLSELGVWDAAGFAQENGYDLSYCLVYKDANEAVADQAGIDLTQFVNTGIRMNGSVNLEDRLLSGTIALIKDQEDLLAMNMGFDDNIFWLGIPQLLSGCYSFDTDTIGSDLVALTGSEELADISFNIFDSLEASVSMQPSEEMLVAFAEAAKLLADGVVYEKGEAEEMDINGHDVKCTEYTMIFSEELLGEFAEAIEDPVKDYMENILDYYEETFRVNMDADEVEAELAEMREAMGVDTLSEKLEEAVEKLSDVEIQLYISGKYVMALHWELEIDEETLDITMQLGGGENYADDFSMILESDDGQTIELVSSGNHTGKDGKFTDKTKINVTEDGETSTINFKIEYEPQEEENNLSFSFSVKNSASTASVGMKAKGQLTLGEKLFELHLDKLTVVSMDVDTITLGLDYVISEYTGADKPENAKLFCDLTEDDFNNMGMEIMTNAQTLFTTLMEKYPVIADLVNSMMYMPY